MDISGKRTMITVANAILWCVITVCGWYGQWFVGLILGVVLMLSHMMMGAAQNGKISMKLLMYPLGSWFVLWAGGFFIAKYYSDLFLNKAPDFTILGFHPSFAMIILAYWIGGVLTLTLGLIKHSDQWLSDESWDAFLAKMKQLNGEEVKNG